MAALWRLADQFQSLGQHEHAARCLAALCNKSAELPSLLARARLCLAALLIDHFDNVLEAKALLLTAEQELRHTQGSHLLRFEVWAMLARCNQRLGAAHAEQNLLLAGLKASRQGASSKDRTELEAWRTHFLFKLAQHSLTHEGQPAAAERLTQLEGQGLTDAERVLHLFCCTTLHLHAGEPLAAAALLEKLNLLIEQAAHGNSLLRKHFRCHYSVVYIAMAVAAGRINDLKQNPGGSISLLALLAALLAETHGLPWSYDWLPAPAIGALGNLLHASLLRSTGKGAPAAAYLLAAQEALDQQLACLGIDMGATETELKVHAIWEGRIYIHLSIMLLEQQALAALAATHFAQCAELLTGLTRVLDCFPNLLRDFAPSVKMLLGHYAHSLQQHAAASAHFRAVLQSDAAHLHNSAAVAAALAELQRGTDPASQHRAVELLQQRGLTELPHALSLPVHDRAAALVISALLALRTGNEGNARLMLTKALKLAHAHLGNTQMVAQVLNLLGPIQAAKGDAAGAEQMLGSAATLAKAQSDVPTLVSSSRSLLQMFRAAAVVHSGGGAEHCIKQADYVRRKEGDVQTAVARAEATIGHAALLAWAPRAEGPRGTLL